MAVTSARSGTANDRFLVERNTLYWGIFLGGLIVGFISLYLVVAQPMLAQLDAMQRELAGMKEDLRELVPVRDQVYEANTLLSALKTQKAQIDDARIALVAMRELRQDLQVESNHTAGSAAALAELVRLQNTLRDQRELTVSASRALEQIVQVQRRLVSEQVSVPTAHATLADIEQTKLGLSELLRVKQQLLEGSQNAAEASTAAGALIALKDVVNARKGDIDAARLYLTKLFALQEELTARKDDTTKAWASLDRLLEMNGKLVAKGPQMAETIANLELLTDFQEEFSERIKSLASMRQKLADVSLLEPVIARVARILEPLASIGNIRRLSESELRDAARAILEKRSATRLSQKPAEPKVYAEERDPFSQAEDRLSKERVPVPVPPPMQDK